MAAKTQSFRLTYFTAFALAGVWAGCIVAFLLINQTRRASTPVSTSEIKLDTLSGTAFDQAQPAARRKFLFNKNKEPRTQEYTEEGAPPLDGEDTTEDFQFAPVTPPVAPPTAPPAVVAPSPPVEPQNEIADTLDSLKKLFNGEGGFQDIIKIAITAFALFGGAKFGSSDVLLKTLLGIFSQKANFNALLEERLELNGVVTRRRKRRTK